MDAYVLGKVAQDVGVHVSAASRKGRRELCLAVDGEGISVHDSNSGSLLATYAVAPATRFVCPAASRSVDNVRHTWACVKKGGGSVQLSCWREEARQVTTQKVKVDAGGDIQAIELSDVITLVGRKNVTVYSLELEQISRRTYEGRIVAHRGGTYAEIVDLGRGELRIHSPEILDVHLNRKQAKYVTKALIATGKRTAVYMRRHLYILAGHLLQEIHVPPLVKHAFVEWLDDTHLLMGDSRGLFVVDAHFHTLSCALTYDDRRLVGVVDASTIVLRDQKEIWVHRLDVKESSLSTALDAVVAEGSAKWSRDVPLTATWRGEGTGELPVAEELFTRLAGIDDGSEFDKTFDAFLSAVGDAELSASFCRRLTGLLLRSSPSKTTIEWLMSGERLDPVYFDSVLAVYPALGPRMLSELSLTPEETVGILLHVATRTKPGTKRFRTSLEAAVSQLSTYSDEQVVLAMQRVTTVELEHWLVTLVEIVGEKESPAACSALVNLIDALNLGHVLFSDEITGILAVLQKLVERMVEETTSLPSLCALLSDIRPSETPQKKSGSTLYTIERLHVHA
ncbi:hypothetical protein PYCC9005_004734 [Savitreella phatthalungensis]